MSTILLFGAGGMLGTRLVEQGNCIPITRDVADLTRIDSFAVDRLIAKHEPTHIINAAAVTAVDAAETDRELASSVNGRAAGIIAAAAGEIPVLHISTDYVFDGADAPYREDAPTSPINHYGASKLAGEELALAAGARVFRVQWLFDKRGTNFFTTMRQLLAEKESLPVVADQWGAPTYTPHLAEALLNSLDVAPGLYHLVPEGFTSRHGFVCAMADMLGAQCRLAPIVSEEYPRPATRPRDTRLLSTKLPYLPHWREGLRDATA